MQLISGTAATDSYSALYVGTFGGDGWWTARWLPGRRLSTDEAVTATLVAEMLVRFPEAGAMQWATISDGADKLELSTRDLAGFLGVECDIPEALSPEVSPRPSMHRMLWSPRRRR